MLFHLVMLLIGVSLFCLMYYCYSDTRLLPSAKLRKGNVFTPVCHSVHMGVCVVGDVHGMGMTGGHAWPGGRAWWGEVGACVAVEMATAAGGTHPTGMHSCIYLFFNVDSNTYLTTNL